MLRFSIFDFYNRFLQKCTKNTPVVPPEYAGGDPAAAKKAASNGTAYFFSLPPDNNPVVLREILRETGVHFYSESGDALQAGGGILVLTPRSPRK